MSEHGCVASMAGVDRWVTEVEHGDPPVRWIQRPAELLRSAPNTLFTVRLLIVVTLAAGCGAAWCADEPQAANESSGREPTRREPSADGAWRPLFDGKTLDGWQTTPFGGEGDVYVEGDELRLDSGSSMTGVTYIGDALPRGDYELRLEARRLQGSDFFCGLTFPVGQQHLSLIVGGWGGSLVGLSSLDGEDAANNETRRTISFRKGEWYRIRLQVSAERVRVWINDEQVIDQSTVGRELSLRSEVELSKPLGIATWETSAAVRKIDVRP